MDRQGNHFAFVIETGFTMQALSSAVEVLRLARKLGSKDRISYSVVSLDNLPVAASNGLSVLPSLSIDRLPPHAILVVVAGSEVYSPPDNDLMARLRLWARRGGQVWAISSGVVRLAQAGLLHNCRVAPHWENIPYLKDNFPTIEISTSLFVLNSKHPTCAGGGAAADLMMTFLASTETDGLVDEIASRLIIDGVRDGRMKQALPERMRYSTSNKTIFAAIRLMEASLFEPLPMPEIARRVGVSQRQLQRLFKAEFKKSPRAVYQEIRLSEARQEILSGRRMIVDIALDFGFDPVAFSKAYRRSFGVLPSSERSGPTPDRA